MAEQLLVAPGAHLVLVGLPGAGKTTAGRLLAERLGRPFLDFDEEIARRTGRTIPEIFRRDGEAAFRAMERALTEELVGADPMVLSPGGGWIMVPGLVELLRPPSRLVHLRISPAAALERLGEGVRNRPLLSRGSPLETLARLQAERAAAYAAADAELNVERQGLQGVIENLVRLASPPGAA